MWYDSFGILCPITVFAGGVLLILLNWRNLRSVSKYVDGDVYLNPVFGDLWVVDGKSFVKINDGYTIDLDDPEGFIKVWNINGIINRKNDSYS